MGRARVLLEEEIAQNLCCHDDNGCVRLELDVACHDADLSRPHLLEIVEFLVGERFDRRRVEDATTLGEGMCNLILADERLS
jgi:hypothetical protein